MTIEWIEMTIKWIEIEKLKPHPKNPNIHSPEQIARLVDIIRYQGWRHPIIAEEGTNIIHAGHGRLSAAKEMGLTKVPVHFQTFTSPEQAYAFLVSDNAIASWAELDLSSINNDIVELGPDFDVDMLGIKDFELDVSDKNEQESESPTCPTCGKKMK